MAKTETKAWKDVDIEDSIAHKDDVRSGVPFLTLEPGKNGKFKKTYLRIMPPRADFPKDTFYLWQKVHFISANGVRRSVLCTEPDTGACRICTHANELTRNGMKSQADELYGRWRGLVNVVEVDAEGNVPEDGKVVVWAAPKETLTNLLNDVADLKKSRKNIHNPETGSDVWVRRKGKGREDTAYEVGVVDTSSVFNGGNFDLLEDMHDLTMVYPVLEDHKIAGLLAPAKDPFSEDDEVIEGEVRPIRDTRRQLPAGRDDDDDDEGEDEAPKESSRNSTSSGRKSTQSTGKSSSKKSSKNDEDEEDAPKPKKRASDEDEIARARASLARAMADDDDDEDDDDDDDDDE